MDSFEEKTYIYNGTEVKLTGRTAEKPVTFTRRTTMTGCIEQARTVLNVLHEITPVDSSEGSWKKWVKKQELYTITKEDNDDTIS